MNTRDMQIIPQEEIMVVGNIANQIADRTAHERDSKKKASNTKRRQVADLQCFSNFLKYAQYGYSLDTFTNALKSGETSTADLWYMWQGITHGIVEAFISWQEQQGYAIGSINVRLATVKLYAEFAFKAGAISQSEFALIKMIRTTSHREGLNIDKERPVTRKEKGTEKGKKASPTTFGPTQAAMLKKQGSLKDVAIMCLLIDMGLRCSELAGLLVKNVDLASETLTFYREKVDLVQTHQLTPDCVIALQKYIPTIKGEYLFPGYKGRPMSTNGINKRVGELGVMVGISDLSPHDCRHYLFTQETRKGTDPRTLQSMGGWTSPAMALRYAEASTIANKGASFFKGK